MTKNIAIALQAFVLAALISGSAVAKTTKEAPAPPAVPVPKVDAEALIPPGPEKLEGTARVVDGDEIRVGDSLIRLYGIAAPDMSARFGPEARVALESLVSSQRVNCQVFGKTPQGDAVGQCVAGDVDPAETMLTQGLAAVYRTGNVNDAEQRALAAKYDAAEAAAREQELGLWQPPAPVPNPKAAADEQLKARVLAYAAFALLILAIFTVSIAQLSIARRNRAEREKLRLEQRTTLSFAMAAELEIVLATARRLGEQVAGLPADRPVPSGLSAALALPSTTFWNANAERLHLLPVDVTVPLLRFHAFYGDTARKLALASALPSGTLVAALNGLVEIGTAAVTAIEASLGIAKPAPPPAPKPKAVSPAPAAPGPSSELNTPPRAATN